MTDTVRITLGFLGFIIAALAFLSFMFPEQIAERISRISKVSITPKGINLDLAIEDFQKAAEKRGEIPPDEKQAKEIINKLVGSSRILWVDDHPKGNISEISSLRKLGHIVDEVSTNNDAMRYFSLKSYNVIISDIKRDGPEGGKAGLELPALLKTVKGSLPPVIYYVGIVDEPLTKAGYPVVNLPSSLFKLLNLALN